MKRIGIFGWGLVGPKSPDIDTFKTNLESAVSFLEPFHGFGPSNFLVGRPQFDFAVYKPWIDKRFEPRKFSQLDQKMGNNVKYAIGAFIQALDQNPELEALLAQEGPKAHVYIGTGLGDYPVQYKIAVAYQKAQKRWNRFWCRSQWHPQLAAYYEASPGRKASIREQAGAPPDPFELLAQDETRFDPGDVDLEEAAQNWFAFWVESSEGLKRYLSELKAIEGVSIEGDVERAKKNVIRRKTAERRKLSTRYGCPIEPWNAVDPNLLWNIANIPAAQISTLGRITGPAFAPVAACSGFGTTLCLAINAIRAGQARLAVMGTTDPEPHPLSVGTFFGARVLSHDGRVSKPFTGMRGTHVAGGACVWIVGDAEWCLAQGLKPLGLEILGAGVTSDADHIITPSKEGPQTAISLALGSAGIEPEAVATWDMHATATPGDWNELQNTLAVFPENTCFTARKGSFGHGMSVSGGWEMTAQHLGLTRGKLLPIDLAADELHEHIRPHHLRLIHDGTREITGDVAGKINMGVGGINACVIARKWPESITSL